MQRLKKKSTLPRAAHAETGVLGGSKKRQEQYSISYEAYRHFAFFTALYLSVTGKPAAAPDVVSWYFKEKWYCIPSEIPKALTSRVYLRLVNNLIVDNCVAVTGEDDDGIPCLEEGKMFPLWAWKDEVFEFDSKSQHAHRHFHS
ncbi:hypothetical protein TGME49_209900 [Toxoplasma gondii ME49]|uniref:Uncharacterized protein n=2 Tax=Toxoplasma gondii TaxID=5811 RepID=A0A086JRL4_TOXGO|nr:hypothetical protein TGME49_209900 [Toxoplasma gondii ME49]EPT32274.1 hypothetical protein TGME49_209900 [Toxoplasma gondii ME49]KFG34782.1 hypothetical protein TGDOM2_209900 [Toxoplasma gondii GAB2-2007-GAL-DOM2]|eukprot:XP_002369739.1 hypothetical protein TGME49_209900 [Toxoplasma gondii ME49]